MDGARRDALVMLGATALAPWALGQAPYPARLVRLVLPYGTGGPSDFTIRLLATELATALNQKVIVENIAGGQGAIGCRRVAKAEPDGHTLLLATSATHAANVFLMKDLGYDPVKDFAPVTGIADLQHVVVVRNDLPVQTMAEFIRHAAANPGRLNYGSSGIGSGGHLGMEALKRLTGIDVQHVPFKSAAQLNLELMAGRVDIAITSMPVALVQIRARTLRALAMASEKRSPQLPELPRLTDIGLAGCESDTWMGLWAPAGTPAPVVARLNGAITAILGKPEVADALTHNAITLNVRETPEFAAYMTSEIERYRRIVRQIGLQPT